MNGDLDHDQDVELLRRACESLGEHFDSVQIFASRYDPAEANGTVSVCFGSGNWFTRCGQVSAWVVRQEEGSRIEARKDFEA